MKRSRLTPVYATLAAWILGNASAEADPITRQFNYQVSGDVGTRAGTPIGNFDFEGAPYYAGNGGVLGGQFYAPGSFPLGEFVARPLPAGAGLTYHDFPFYLRLNVAPSGMNAFQGGEVDIQGLLNGTVTGPTSSTVIATIASMSATGPLPFPLEDLRIDVPQALSPNGATVLTAEIVSLTATVPEPSTFLIAALMVAGPILRRLRRRA